MIFAGKLKNFTEKLKKFQKYSISGKFIYFGCLNYGEKGSLLYADKLSDRDFISNAHAKMCRLK